MLLYAAEGRMAVRLEAVTPTAPSNLAQPKNAKLLTESLPNVQAEATTRLLLSPNKAPSSKVFPSVCC